MTPYQARKEFLPFSPPLIGEREVAAVTEVLLNGWLSSGPKTKEFEEKFKAYVGAESALVSQAAREMSSVRQRTVDLT